MSEAAKDTASRCRHFGRGSEACGGCSRLDVPIGVQVEQKRAALEELLAPFLGAVTVVADPPPHLPLHTRTKLSWPVQPDATRGLRLGMYARGSHELVEIAECRVQDPALTKLARRAAEVLRGAAVEAYDERTHAGQIRAFHARIASGSGELILGLTTRGGRFDAGPRIARGLLDAASNLRDARGRRLTPVGVVRSIHDEPGNALLGRRHVPLLGRDHQVDRVAGLAIRIGFPSFYQSHRNADAVLFRPALTMLGPVAGMRVVDGYGGVGTFGLRLARAGAAAVEVVESNPSACADARHNAAINRLPQVTVVEAPFSSAGLLPAPDLCVVDPPRKGLEPAGVDRLLALQPHRVLYVACGPDALARDLHPLHRAGYRIRAARMADLFPHTEHVEALVLLAR